VFLVAIGRNDESIAETERARRLEPTSATVMWECAIVYYEARRFDRALAQLHLELELYPNTTIAHALMAAILARQGRKAESLAALDRVRSLLAECEDLVTDGWVIEAHAFCGNHAEALRLLEKWESIAELRYVDATTLAFANAAVRRRDKAIALLERAAEEKSPMFPWLRSQPSLEPLHADARYQALVRRMNYAW
jgi:tetratricopeptide (TPR) repeat protein